MITLTAFTIVVVAAYFLLLHYAH